MRNRAAALMEAVGILKAREEEGDALDFPYRWMRILNERIQAGGLKDEDTLIIAQRLLELPIKRALAETRMLADTGA